MNTNPHILLLISTLLIVACGHENNSNLEPDSVSAVSDRSGSGIALKTEIPSEQTQGTPPSVKVPNLESVATEAPVLIVPEETALLSTGKAVTSSDSFLPIVGELSYITDGDKDAGDGYFVELSDGPQWVQIDLGETAQISAVWIWHYHLEARAYHDVIVQLSNDAEFKSSVTTLFNNDYDNSSRMGRGSDRPYVDTRFGKLIDAKGSLARYVRLYSNGNTSSDMNHYIEVEVFGLIE